MTSKHGHASKRRVKFVPSEPEKVELSESTIAIKIVTPPCPLCGKLSTVMLSRTEFKAVAEGAVGISQALPGRDQAFRDLFTMGWHPQCWDAANHQAERESGA